MAQWPGEKNVGYGPKRWGDGPRSWQSWLLILTMILVVIGAWMAAIRLTDLPRWMPLVVIVLTTAVAIILLAMTREGGGE